MISRKVKVDALEWRCKVKGCGKVITAGTQKHLDSMVRAHMLFKHEKEVEG